MFLPIGDEPRLRGTPIVNLLLIAVNVAVFVLISWPLTRQAIDLSDPLLPAYLRALSQESGLSPREILTGASAYDLFVFQHGFKPADPQLVDLFVSLFLHAGWMHLGGNMLFLWIFGHNVELHFGRVGYLTLYLGTGVLATLFFTLFRLDSAMPLVGASGAISGLLGLYFVWFPKNRVRLLVVLFFFIDVIRIRARWVLGFYLLVENLLPFVMSAQGGGVAYGAHIGGFLAGLGAAIFVDRWQRRDHAFRRVATSELGSDVAGPAGVAPDAVTLFEQAAGADDWAVALRAYSEMSQAERVRVRDPDLLALAQWLADVGHHDTALVLLQRLIATRPLSPALAGAHLLAGYIYLEHRQQLPPAYQHFLSVLDLDAPPEIEHAARSGLAEIEARSRRGPRARH